MPQPTREQRGEPLGWCEQCEAFHRVIAGNPLCRCVKTINGLTLEVHRLNNKVEELRAIAYGRATQIENLQAELDRVRASIS